MNDLIWEISRQGDYFSYQLSQVAGLKDIETVSRMDAGTITLYFPYSSVRFFLKIICEKSRVLSRVSDYISTFAMSFRFSFVF